MQIRCNFSDISKNSAYKINFTGDNLRQGNSCISDSLKADFSKKCNLYPEDVKYLEQIAKEINLPLNELYKLKSIIGPAQIEDIISNSERKNFNPGEIIKHSQQYTKSDLENLAKRGFRINLHIHTTHSDGKMSVKELLDQAANYADIVNTQIHNDPSRPAFVIAITDHDNLDGAKEAIRIIAENPEKYKNLGIVPGCELSAIYKNKEMLAKPFAYEMVAYSINPFDAKLNSLLNNTRNSRIELSKQIINEANKKYPDMNFSYEEACQIAKNPKKGIDGFLYILANYFKEKANAEGKDIDTFDLSLKYLPTNEHTDRNITNTAEDLFGCIKDNYGFLGISHPAKIYLGGGKINESFIQQCKAENKNSGREIINHFINYLTRIGGSKFKALETNYQSYEGSLRDAQNILNGENVQNQVSTDWVNQFREFAKKLNLLEAGGLDTHSENPFLRK